MKEQFFFLKEFIDFLKRPFCNKPLQTEVHMHNFIIEFNVNSHILNKTYNNKRKLYRMAKRQRNN